MTQPNNELSASNVPKSGEVVETRSTTLASIPKPSDAQTPIDKAMDAVARQQFDSLVKNWPSLLNDKPEILAAFGSTAAAADFLKRCYEGGNKVNGNLQYNSLWGNEILDYIRTTKNPTPDGLKNFAIGLRKTGQGTLETTISEAKMRGRFAGRIDGAVLGKWLNEALPALKKSGYSTVDLAMLKAQVPSLTVEDAKEYVAFSKSKLLSMSNAVDALSLANGEVEKAKDYAQLTMRENYSYEKLAALIPVAQELGITNVSTYLKGVDFNDALQVLNAAKQLGYSKEIAIALKSGLDFSRYAIERMRVNSAGITLKAISSLVDYGFTNNEIENFICDERFPWERIAVAEQSTAMRNFLKPEYSWLTKDILSLDPVVFDKVYGEFSQDENYKKVAGTKLFAATLVNYVQKFGADALAQSREAVSVYTAGVEGGVKLSLDEAQELTARSPDYEPRKVMAFINAIHAARPDFYSQVSNFNANVNVVTIFALARGDGNISQTMSDIKRLEDAGFTPMEICIAAQRGKKGLNSSKPSFTVMTDNLLAYKTNNPGIANEQLITAYVDNFASLEAQSPYLRLAPNLGGETPTESYIANLNKHPRFAAAIQKDPELPNKLYKVMFNADDIINTFGIITRSGITINPEDLPLYIKNAYAKENNYSGAPVIADIVNALTLVEGLTTQQRTDIFANLLKYKRAPDALSYLNEIEKSGVPPAEWPIKLAKNESFSEFKSSLITAAQGVASL